jgi:hypothetical protein
MKKKLLMTVTLFIAGFIAGFICSDCMAQTIKDNSAVIIEGKAEYSIPEVYELMQVAMALTDTTITTGKIKMYKNNVETNTAYYKEVIQKFGAYKNHAFISKLNKSLSKSAVNYIYQLQKAFNTSFTASDAIKNKQMPFIRRIWIGFHSVSRKELEIFGNETGFREFYAAHLPYYNALLQDVKDKLAVSKMQDWLEKQFAARYDKYKIVLSPLSNAFHFTQNFKYKGDNTNIIWISAPAQYDTTRYTQKEIAAMYSGVAFTEIDHNYINSVTDKFKAAVNEIMGGINRKNWIDESGDAALYNNGYKIFNEYMTHAVYLLYIKDVFGGSEYKTAFDSKMKGMIERRKYYRFKAFYEMLLLLYQNKTANQTLTDLYPATIEWCQKINKQAS